MADDTVILASRVDVDNVVFSACTEVAEKLPGMSVRDKTKFAIAAADRIMEGMDELGGKAKRSEAGKKAAEARYSKDKTPKPQPLVMPTPGPAIPQTAPGQPMPPVASEAIPANMLPPPPHPALIPPNAPGATPMPFGAPPP